MLRNIPEFHVLDMAAVLLRRHADLDLQLVVARAGRLPGRALRGQGRRSSRTSASSSGSSRCGTSCPRSSTLGIVRDPDGLRRRRRAHLRRRCSSTSRSTSPRPPSLVHARRPGHDHLHVGHDRPAQGRDDHPLQRRLDGREPACGRIGDDVDLRRQAAGVVPADGPHRRADDQPLPAGVTWATRSPCCPEPAADRPRTPGRCGRNSCSACPGCGRRSTPASPAALAADPEKKASSSTRPSRRPSRSPSPRSWGEATDEQNATWDFLDDGRLPPGARAARPRPASRSPSPAPRPSPPSCSSGSGPSACRCRRSTACPRTPGP